MEKANACLLDVHCDIRGWDWDVHFLWKYPRYSWNIQTVWQCSIQLEPTPLLNPPIHLNKLSVGAVCSWLTDLHKKRKKKKCLLPNWPRSVSDNRGILEWILKRIIFFLPLLLEICHAFGLRGKERGWSCIFILSGWRKTRQRGRCGRVGKKQSGRHAKKGGRRAHPYVHLDWL